MFGLVRAYSRLFEFFSAARSHSFGLIRLVFGVCSKLIRAYSGLFELIRISLVFFSILGFHCFPGIWAHL